MRRLSEAEVSVLLARDVPAHLATIDANGYPHVTPIWFIWDDGLFRLTSFIERPHLSRIRSNPRVGLVVDVEASLRHDGERPNQQVRIVGDATVGVDSAGAWTERIRRKYIDQRTAPDASHAAQGEGRALITVAPTRIVAVASV
jgi:hypothetical protein